MKDSPVLYPNITVELSESDGNAFAILGKVRKALRKNGVTDEDCKLFIEEATSGSYDNLLRVCMKWVNIL